MPVPIDYPPKKAYTLCMKKPLSQMTLSELWQLFPIVLTEHKPYWKAWYEEEVRFLQTVSPCVTYHHIGSTAVDGIWAKPIVDILAETDTRERMRSCARLLQNGGYIVMAESDGRISLNKGYTEDGFAEKVFHLHLRLTGDTDEVYFRDYLIAHPDIAKEYERLKLSVWKKYEHDRDGYTDAKANFVKKYTAAAKRERAARENA